MDQHIGAAWPFGRSIWPMPLTRVEALPDHWFLPSEELHAQGWPDFSIRSLADWSSSQSPASDIYDDCCLALTLPYLLAPVDRQGEWTFLAHETGGQWQFRRKVVALPLLVGERGWRIIHDIARAMANSNCASQHHALDQIEAYRRFLNGFGLDCNRHFPALAEGFYPIDLEEDALTALDLFDEHEVLNRIDTQPFACLAILAPNCTEQ